MNVQIQKITGIDLFDEKNEGEILIAFLKNVSIREAGSFPNPTTNENINYEQGVKLRFAIAQKVEKNFAGEIITEDGLKEYNTVLIEADKKKCLQLYKEYKANIGGKFFVPHSGVSGQTVRGVFADKLALIMPKEPNQTSQTSNKNK